MKVVGIREYRGDLNRYMDAAQKERTIITRHGRPYVMLVGVEGRELPDVIFEGDPAFWEEMKRRLSGPRAPLEEVMRRFEEQDAQALRKKKRPAARPGKGPGRLPKAVKSAPSRKTAARKGRG